MVLLQNHFVQNELRQFIFIECSLLDIHQGSGKMMNDECLRSTEIPI